MKMEDYIPIHQISVSHEVEITFFDELEQIGLIQIISREQVSYIHHDDLPKIERMIRLYHELDINIPGIDVIVNLLYKIENLQQQLNDTQNRLRLYEGE